VQVSAPFGRYALAADVIDGVLSARDAEVSASEVSIEGAAVGNV
jgi:hypothetical protein